MAVTSRTKQGESYMKPMTAITLIMEKVNSASP